jgi:hypothetical protein
MTGILTALCVKDPRLMLLGKRSMATLLRDPIDVIAAERLCSPGDLGRCMRKLSKR